MKAVKLSLNKKKRNITVRKINDFEFKIMVGMFNKEEMLSSHRNLNR
jgi:hypothetical protein